MSKNELIEFWKNRKTQPKIKEFKCLVCDYLIEDINKLKKYKSNDIFYAGELIRHQCPNCKVIFGDMRFLLLSEKEISNDYKNLYSFYKEGPTHLYLVQLLDEINLGKNKTYLNFACGNNLDTINVLDKSEYNIYHYDKYVNIEHPKFLNKIKDNQKFDIVWNNNYLEHLINPYKQLKEMVDLLKKNGKLIISTPCWTYCFPITHYHTFFFIEKSFDFLCKKLNLKFISTKNLTILKMILQ